MNAAYRLEGTVVDQPDGRWTVTAWIVTRGEVGGVDVSGRTVLVLQPGPVLILDENATPEQVQAVRAFFADQALGFYLAPITVRAGELSVSIPERGIDCHLTIPYPS